VPLQLADEVGAVEGARQSIAVRARDALEALHLGLGKLFAQHPVADPPEHQHQRHRQCGPQREPDQLRRRLDRDDDASDAERKRQHHEQRAPDRHRAIDLEYTSKRRIAPHGAPTGIAQVMTGVARAGSAGD
jgi:hypothetical protein